MVSFFITDSSVEYIVWPGYLKLSPQAVVLVKNSVFFGGGGGGGGGTGGLLGGDLENCCLSSVFLYQDIIMHYKYRKNNLCTPVEFVDESIFALFAPEDFHLCSTLDIPGSNHSSWSSALRYIALLWWRSRPL